MGNSATRPSATRNGARASTINVLAKTSALLDALDDAGELTPAEIADRIGEPRSSVYRLLDSLENIGFVAPGVKRGYIQLGIKLYRLGSSAVRHRNLRAAALPLMLDLRDQTGSTIFLTIRSGDEALCIERIEGSTIVNNALLPGTTGPLHIGAGGKALLAAEPPAFWDEYAASGLVGFTQYSVTTRDGLVAMLEQVKQTGISISDQDRLLGMAGVGAQIHDHDGHVCAAISLSGPLPLVLEDQRERSFALITDAAAQVSAALGYEQATV
ncbi:IclR family transcriptional regulator [Conexibacter woesei]|uniref:Transcriptional regulator, IclR family n=1 Tax=Conexibacter woesei (strain DSM 14684 / CCUG 47730 / CIP 108061 / JCM 11494 / NBRC 100937 / ID131577) TaxID=469383 RepID=D3F6C8_CONWI|nr:IclR family transcriptional regulator [Conexibacter woesei]ADB50695.1 transcriptional regulator, IclR family [Conexibacter woesei DSM 14684]